jgi:phosphoribosylanthranilate isomerase
MVRIKICGITNWSDAKAALDAGADALGFNFYPPSPRAVTPSQAWGMIRKLPPLVEAVGVFVNWPPEAIAAMARALRLSAVQLHGDESGADVRECASAHRVIKAIRVGRGFRPRILKTYAGASAFLLDGFQAKLYGGSGKTFAWGLARQAKKYGLVILAGGLTPENVAEAIRAAEPYAVDVASGVESRPGKKDPSKVKEFVRQVQRAGS